MTMLRTKTVLKQLASLFSARPASKRAPVASFSTYYDSQSGLHIPHHDEKAIRLILSKASEDTGTDSFIPAQFYKEDASSEVPDKLESLSKQGVQGLCLPPAKFPRDLRNLQTLCNIAPQFRFFVASTADIGSDLLNVSLLHHFDMDEPQLLRKVLSSQAQAGNNTTIFLGESVCVQHDSMSIATQLGTLIDSTGAGNFLWLRPPTDADGDDVLQLCEELMYLDVAGPTIKSRIIIDSNNEEVIDETMNAGISQFVIHHEDDIDLIESTAKWQGKQIAIE
eukprot:Nitzschia sp. Nitz4//scaffold133_size116822//24170//25009//NITZ4_003797-RA/size116822-processed-gene-0.51-mRNA-1//-1//CDS//3329535366//6571//frame0